MSIELQPLGVKCNIACSYCYQEPMREAGNEEPYQGEYDLEKMKKAAILEGVGKPDRHGNPTGFSVFGGEPLLLPIKDLEELFRWGRFDMKTHPGVQTNASLITDRHIELFKKYSVGVGVSIDGPGELNDARAAKDPRATRATTEKSIANFTRMLKEGINCSLIVTLHMLNAGNNEKLERLIAWIEGLKAIGLKWMNLHALEIDTELGKELVLSEAQHVHVMRTLRARITNGIKVSPFSDMSLALMGQDEEGVNCVWNACDPYTTDAVRGVDGQGNRGNCGRTNKDGAVYAKSQQRGYERQLALYLTPQENGGCQGCRFFYACKGECPGTGENQDWRARTAHCSMLMAVFGDLEQELFAQGKEPISASLQRPQVEANLLRAWGNGQRMSIAAALRHQSTVASNQHGDEPHGDMAHGDSDHGDHTDAQNPVITHGDTNV